MYMRVITLALAGFLMSGNIWGHGGTITGIVKDGETGVGVPGASVQFEGTSLGNVADLNGSYEISHLTPGQYTIIVSAVGYRTLTKK